MSKNSSLDRFCGSTFWDSNLTWYTNNPDLTPCFQKTILVWIPCMYLWVASLFEIYNMYKSKERDIPWNKLNITKLVVIFLLIMLHIVDIGQVIGLSRGEETYAADFYGAAVKLLTFCLVATIMCYNRKYGLRTSGALFFFWLLLIFAGLPQLRTETFHYSSSDESNSRYNFASYIVYYSLIIFMFLLNCFADLPPSNSPYSYTKNQSPEDHSGFPSRLTFSWFDPLAWTGYRRSLIEDDLWPLNPQLVSKETAQRFEKFWERATKKRSMTGSNNMNSNDQAASDEPRKQVSLLPIVCKAFGAQFVFAMILKLVNDLLTFASPKLLEFLIGFIEGNEPVWRGYLYAMGMFISSIIQSMLLGQYFIRTTVVGVKIKNSLCTAIYKKALRLSNAARKHTTVGELINLMSTDVDRFSNLMFINLVWSAPLQITLSLYFLWEVLGPSVLAGVAVIIVLMPFNGVIAGFQEKLQTRMMVYKDERMKLMNEVLNGIKVLKMYAWEPSFQSHIMKIRNKEMKLLKKLAYLNSATSFIWFCTPFLVSLMSFTCFVLVNDTEVLNSKRAFVALSLFNIMRFPMTLLPNVISDIIQTSVSIKRLNKLLNSEELDDSAVEHNPDESEQIVIENGYFSWGNNQSELILKEINLRVSEGSLVAIVGTVGTGKSSLLSAILGEMNKVSGRVNVKGQVAYVPQQAWIQNATIQNNILFGKPLDRVKYNNILDVCALTTDLEILAGGDQTEIGEKGINLSGGQKQRIALARAVYYDAENYLLDDPLSAVDSHVGKHIFDEVIGRNGLLKQKTRVWVTNNVSYLSQTDMVVVLRDGKISEVGSYHHLLENKGAFAEFLLHHLSLAEKTSSLQDLEKIKQDLETNLGPEFERKLQWARSVSTIESEGGATESGEHSDVKKLEEHEKGKDEYVNDVNKLIETETTETGRVKWSVYMHYLTNVGVIASLATVAMQIILHALQIGGNFWLAKWSNDDSMLINGTVDPKRRDMYLGIYGGFGIAQAMSSFLADLMPFLACWRAAKILHSIMLDNMLKAPLQFFEVTPIGRILSRFSKDVEVVDSALPWQISNVLSSSFEVIGTLLVISYSTPMFIMVILPIGFLYYVIQRFYVPTSRQIMRIESVARSPVYSQFSESILGAASIRAFGVMDRFVTHSQQKVDHYQSFSYLSAVADRWLGIRLEVICSLIIFFAALFTVIERESISPGLAGLSVSYTLEITQTLSWLVQMASGVETDIVAVERMKEYGETEQEAAWTLPQGPRPSWPETGALQLNGLTISYRGGKPALRDLTCTVTPRDKIGIVGRTGAGKSTLTLGLFRIVEPMEGRILLDGLDVSTIGLHQLRSRITIIPQDPVLFSGTLRINLDPFEAYSDAELWRALEHAHLKPFVEGLEAGLLHEVAEGGENLSLGQRQLVCLARALLRKTRLLVLDEATAAVDLETDELIQKTIRSEFASCTVLTIAHRLNTIMDSTKVMVLDKGQLVEYAPPQELLKNKESLFYTLAKNSGLV